jgi:D-amino peptidase
MKVYISVDIEGSAGITHWDEAAKRHCDYPEFRERMTAEAVAACEGALAAGAREIWVKDAHGSGRNILAERLPGEVRLIRGWSGHPFCMLQELDESFNAAAVIGWHGAASHPDNPLSHTLTGFYGQVTLNGMLCSEYLLHAHIAALVDTPIVFLSGDSGICAQARTVNRTIHTVETNTGRGESVISIQPDIARERIPKGIETALRSDLLEHTLSRSDHYELRMRFKHHGDAYRNAFYPGARLADSETVVFEADDFMEIARILRFMR